MKVAILVDGGYYRKRANHVLGKKSAKERSQELYDYCYKHLFSNKKSTSGDYLYRIFYYDCPPIDKQIFHPFSKKILIFQRVKPKSGQKSFSTNCLKSVKSL